MFALHQAAGGGGGVTAAAAGYGPDPHFKICTSIAQCSLLTLLLQLMDHYLQDPGPAGGMMDGRATEIYVGISKHFQSFIEFSHRLNSWQKVQKVSKLMCLK